MSPSIPTTNSYTRRIAAFVSGLGFEQIPGEVIDSNRKLLILDALGCASLRC